MARAFIQEPNTAPIAPHNCSCGSCGNALPFSRDAASLYLADQFDPVVAGRDRCRAYSPGRPCGVENVLEVMMLEAEHHVRIHRDEAAIAVIGEAAIAGEFGERFDRLVVEAEIEHGVHHARHRGAAAGAHRHQQRIGRIAERLAGHLADVIERAFDLRLQLLRDSICRARRNRCRRRSEW